METVIYPLDTTIHRMNPLDNSIGFGSTYLMETVIYPLDTTTHWITQEVLLELIQQIVIYLQDSTIHCPNHYPLDTSIGFGSTIIYSNIRHPCLGRCSPPFSEKSSCNRYFLNKILNSVKTSVFELVTNISPAVVRQISPRSMSPLPQHIAHLSE